MKALFDYIRRLHITQGLPWQRRFVRGAFAPGAWTAIGTVTSK